MNIGFDAQAILGLGSKNRGIGNYSTSLFNTLINLDKDNNYFCLNVFDEKITDNYIKKTDNFNEVNYYTGPNLKYVTKEFEPYYSSIVSDFIIKNNIDVFYITSPFDVSFMSYKKEWFLNAKVVSILYDIIPWIFKDHYLRDEYYTNKEWYLDKIETIKSSDLVFAISNSAKEDFVKEFNYDENKTVVINGAPDDRFKVVDISEERKKELKKKFGINKKFLICTGGDDMRKNLDGLIAGYSKVDERVREEYQLVIVCKIGEESKKNYMEIAKDNGVENDVIFTGFVDDNEIVELYNLAYAMVFVSKYEGFGLPVVEAFSCHIPVVSSNNSSLYEVGVGSAIMINPYDPNEIAKGITELLTTANIEEMIKGGIKKLEIYNWNSVAQICKDSVNSIDISNSSLIKNLAIFTPLPPMESGISDFSYDVICGLAKHIDRIDVYIDDYQTNVELPKNVNVLNHKEFIPMYDQILYEVGNSFFHTYMFKYIELYKGVVELHDSDLNGVFSADSFYRNGINYDLFKKYYLDDLGLEKVKEIIENNIMPHEFNLNKSINSYITKHAKSLILHSRYAIKSVLDNNIDVNINYIPHYVKINELANRNEARERLGIKDDTVIIGAFGFIADTKRYIEIIKACKLLKDKGYKFVMYFVGKINDDYVKNRYDSLVKESGLEKEIIVTGYTELNDFIKYIDSVDICLNLRYPYNGETSGVLVRSLSKGKCIITNNVGFFGELPDDVCYKINAVEKFKNDEEEIETIANSIEELIKNKELRERLEKNARKYAVENLDLNILIPKYLTVLNNTNHTDIVNLDSIISLIKQDKDYNKYDEKTKNKIIDTICMLCK